MGVEGMREGRLAEVGHWAVCLKVTCSLLTLLPMFCRVKKGLSRTSSDWHALPHHGVLKSLQNHEAKGTFHL